MHSLKRPYGRLIKFVILLSIFLFTMGGISCEVGEMLVEVVQNTIELKVMTYNVYRADPDGPEYKKWRNRKDDIVEMIALHNPDVIGVQEAISGQIDYIVEELPQYDCYWVGRDDGDEEGETAAIFFLKERFRINYEEGTSGGSDWDWGNPSSWVPEFMINHGKGTFWFSETPWKCSKGGWDWGNPSHKRICSWVRLSERETGKTFYFYNLHLEHGSDGATARLKSVVLLGEKIDARAHPENLFIVVGDFNAKPNKDPIEYVVDDLGYLDTYAETNEDTSEGYTAVGWDGDGRNRIDYIFTHPNALLTDSYVLPHLYSDHRALITKLLLPKELIITDELN